MADIAGKSGGYAMFFLRPLPALLRIWGATIRIGFLGFIRTHSLKINPTLIIILDVIKWLSRIILLSIRGIKENEITRN
jgi:hypothetical protein